MTFVPLKPLKTIVKMKEDLLQLSVVTSHMLVFSILGTITKTILAEETYTLIMTGFMTGFMTY